MTESRQTPAAEQTKPGASRISNAPWGQPEIMLLFLIIGGLCLFFFPRVNSDGAYYYEFLRSTVFDHDLNFFNERMFYTYREVPLLVNFIQGNWQETGYPPNIFTIGPALLWSIPYISVFFVNQALCLISNAPQPSGYELAYRLVPGIISVLQGYIALLIIYRMALRFFPKRESFAGLVIFAFASNLPAFMYITPAFSHLSSLFMVTCFVWLWWISEESVKELPSSFYLLYGAVGGLCAVMRVQDAFMMLLPCCDIIMRVVRRQLKSRLLLKYCSMAAAFLFFLTPHLIATLTLYGKLFVDPQGAGGMLWLHPRFQVIFFDSLKGLFTVNPIYLVACLGLALLLKTNTRLGFGALTACLLQFYVNSVRRDPFGVGFGMRRFITCIPFFILGLCAILSAVSRWRMHRLLLTGLLCLLIPWNFLLMAQYYYSELGAPWISMPFATMIARQFTLSPQLLIKLIGDNLVIGSLTGTLQSFFSILMIGFVFAALLTTFARIYRLHRDRFLQLAQSSRVVAALGISVFVIDCCYLYAWRDTRTIITIDFSRAHMLAGSQTLRLRRDAEWSGGSGGLSFSNNGISWDKAHAEYDRNVFLAQGQYQWSVEPIAEKNKGLSLAINYMQPIKAIELVSFHEEKNLANGTELLTLNIHKKDGSPESFAVKSGISTASGIIQPLNDDEQPEGLQSAPPLLQNPLLKSIRTLKPTVKIPDYRGKISYAYWSSFALASPAIISGIEFIPANPQPRFVITGLAVVPARP